ncbi:MAG: HD domain-containing protein [Ktedonobacteraceae bacterium]
MRTNIEESQILSQVYDEVQERFKQFDDPAHGWEHIQRVYHLAMHMAEQEGADRFITGMAALLHDLGRVSHEQGQHHADLSVSEAQELCQRRQIAPETREAILHAIVAHSFSRGVQPHTLEAYIVRDADRLDGLGAIGVMRWAITGAVRRTPETLCYHPDDPFAEQHTPDDGRYMLDHFFRKLLKLGEGMSTATGRKLAEQRTAFMRVYLDEFRRELAE